jgi:predicted RNA methylase
MLSTARRRTLGAYYTPADVVDALVAMALTDVSGAPRVCDPACGDGAFLLGVARALERRGMTRHAIAHDLLWGIDVDPGAITAARAAIVAWAGVDPGDHLRVGDALAFDAWPDHFDVVVGNPPFLNQLERATVRATKTRWDAGPYTDTAWLFLLVALDLVRDGGRVVLVQPQSIAAARDAGPIRAAVEARAAVVDMWTGDATRFEGVTVDVCAPVLVRGSLAPRTSTWGAWLRQADAPPPVVLAGERTLGDLVTATAGFRDQFYGLAPFVLDDRDGDGPPLVTSGLIDPLRCAWGELPARFAGTIRHAPRVDVDAMADGALKRWVLDRLVPKVVLATQTKVLEPAIDRDGRWVPSTPVIAVHTRPDQLGHVAAVLLAPPVSAWAARRFAGAALSAGAIKLSAKQVGTIPLPPDGLAWDDAARAALDGDVDATAVAMTEAYEAGPDVLEWWRGRRPARAKLEA